MKEVTVNADALRRVLEELIGPGHIILELQVIHNLDPEGPINILINQYNEAVKLYNDKQ